MKQMMKLSIREFSFNGFINNDLQLFDGGKFFIVEKFSEYPFQDRGPVFDYAFKQLFFRYEIIIDQSHIHTRVRGYISYGRSFKAFCSEKIYGRLYYAFFLSHSLLRAQN